MQYQETPFPDIAKKDGTSPGIVLSHATRLNGIEPPHMPPEGIALSPELQTHFFAFQMPPHQNASIMLTQILQNVKCFLPFRFIFASFSWLWFLIIVKFASIYRAAPVFRSRLLNALSFSSSSTPPLPSPISKSPSNHGSRRSHGNQIWHPLFCISGLHDRGSRLFRLRNRCFFVRFFRLFWLLRFLRFFWLLRFLRLL